MLLKILSRLAFGALLAGVTVGCSSSFSPEALGSTPPGNGPVVNFDVYHTPFPEIPLPNDFATRFDPSSPTHLRLNASILAAHTAWEQQTRAQLDKASGWGTLAPITVSFSKPIDPNVIIQRHYNDNFNYKDDAVLVIDVTPGSPGYCEAVPLDLGQGNYPEVLAEPDLYPPDTKAGEPEHDPRYTLGTLTVETTEEDKNHNGKLDPGEDTDMDGVLDHPDTLDGTPTGKPLEFYERETNTLIMKPVMPMREQTTYAVVLTKRLTSPSGDPVRSPFPGINNAAQTTELKPLGKCLPRYDLGIKDVAFTWAFTTQSITHDYKLVRDGLYGLGPLKKVGKDFPAKLSTLVDVADKKPGVTNTKIVPADQFTTLAGKIMSLTGSSDATVQGFETTMKAVDYIVSGTIKSPQFFPRNDADGNRLPLYDQVWNLKKPPRGEDVPFWIFVPKHRTGPAPVAIFIHGHGGSMFDALPFGGILASFGIATMGIDAPSHGVALSAAELALVRGQFQAAGLTGLGEALLGGRALDWNGDGSADSGDDFWTAYVFHTRDEVRQTVVDVMQLVRTLRTFDGKNKWAFDPAGHGSPGLAGDFDGDGKVDVGGSASIDVMGGSLGGITDATIAGLEPQISTVVSIVPGGMLNEIGRRSTLSGVKNAMVLRAIGPLFFKANGKLMLHANDGNTTDAKMAIADLSPQMQAGDTVVLKNLDTHEYRCAAVQAVPATATAPASTTFQVAVSSDKGDRLELAVYHGVLPPKTPEGCVIPSESPYVDITTFGYEVSLSGDDYAADSPLVAPTDGFGMRRNTPDLRRFLGLSQIALDPADPMNWAPYWSGKRKLTYGTGETVHTNVMLMPSIGDPGVMVADGIALGRAAGYIPYDHNDPRYGKSDNQELIDVHAIEGTARVSPYHDSQGNPVLMDVDHLSSVMPGVDDGFDVPRLDPPMRLMHQNADGTWDGFIPFMLDAQGKHGFVSPDPTKAFDLGTYLVNIVGRYLQTDARGFSWDKCQALSKCPWTTFPLQ